MSRKKGKSKAKGSAKSTPHRAPSNRHSSQPWPTKEAAMAPKFSLTEEARWMSSHRTAAYEAGKKLRHMPIQFISAGCLQGTIKERPPAVDPADTESDGESIAASSSSSAAPDNTAAMAHMALRSPSPAPSESSSSGDEVVFRGRGQELPVAVPTTAKPLQTKPNSDARADDSCSRTAHSTPQLTIASTAGQSSVSAGAEEPASTELSIRVNASTKVKEDSASDSEAVVQDQFERRRGGRPAWEGTTTEWQHRSKPNVGWLPVRHRPEMDAFLRGDVNPRDAALDDYMQNMEEFGLTADAMAASGFARREMDIDAGSHNDWESASSSQGGHDDEEEEAKRPNEPHDSWDSDMLEDFADLSTSSDVVETIARILAKRTRKSGLQYLCVYEGYMTDDARWLPCSFFRSPAEIQLVRAFEEEADLREQQQSSSSDSAKEDDEDEDEEEETDEDDEEIDDETLARVLQKQEELGLGSDEVLLYAGDEYFDAPFSYKSTSFGNTSKSKKKQQSRGRGNREPSFPSASALADALAMDPYGGFDIMDTERPSLRIKKKGRRGQMPPELDDSDLNDQLRNAWENDRAKKRLKKAEREELRQQGLLGRKGKGPDLKVKYQGGVAMEDVVEEIRELLMGDMQTLSLPPMDAHRRATVHQAAAFFNLSSRSRGDGQNRFTVLSKTTHTRSYTDDEFDIAIQRKGFLKRLQGPLHSQGGARKGGTFRTGARNKPQTGYKDGETVGADAPALGPENKGHALLSKMGWSTGMGLGALDNKGILQPIPHTVKTNKAGLQ